MPSRRISGSFEPMCPTESLRDTQLWTDRTSGLHSPSPVGLRPHQESQGWIPRAVTNCPSGTPGPQEAPASGLTETPALAPGQAPEVTPPLLTPLWAVTFQLAGVVINLFRFMPGARGVHPALPPLPEPGKGHTPSRPADQVPEDSSPRSDSQGSKQHPEVLSARPGRGDGAGRG